METVKRQWREELEYLIAEVMASKKAYGALTNSDRHPHKQAYFKKRFKRQQYFGEVLKEEFRVQNIGTKEQLENTHAPIFSSFENDLLEDSMTDKKVDLLILEKEQDLIVIYQRVLAHIELPGLTNAILQSQAEELNGMRQGLLLDYRIKHNAELVYK